MELATTPIPNTKGVIFSATFKSGLILSTKWDGRVKNKDKYYEIWQYLSSIEDNIQFFKHPRAILMYLPPAHYWKIYKKMEGGKTFLTSYEYADEEQNTYRFPQPQDYFDSTFENLAGGNGIYGIYASDNLIYIGYTTRGFTNRFSEHRECFTRKSGPNPMYSKYSLETIEFRELITETEL